MKVLEKLIKYTTSILLILCLGWILCNSVGKIPEATNIYAGKKVTLQVLLGAFFLAVCLWSLRVWSRFWEEKWIKRGSIIVFFLVFLVQIVYLYFVRYYVSFDNVLVLNEAKEMLETGRISPDFYNAYFQRYPHNYPITVLLYWILRVGAKLGIHNAHLLACLLGLVCMNLAMIFSWKIICAMKGPAWGFVFAVAALLNPIIYIWIPWHYTTVCMLPFISICMYLAIKIYREKEDKVPWKLAILLGIALALGMKLRITLVIWGIALLIVGIGLEVWKRKHLLKAIIPFMAAFLLVWGVCGAVNHYYAAFDSSDREFTVAHYLMMGLNGDGTFNNDDVNYTDRIRGKSEKTKEDLKVAKERLQEMGLGGLIKHTAKKMLVTWQDGSCGFDQRWIIPCKYTTPYLYICGEKNDVFLYYAQCFYVMLLLFTIVGAIFSLRQGQLGSAMVLQLFLLGNILFYCLWEAQSHYSIGMIFVFLILAIHGMETLSSWKIKDKAADSTVLVGLGTFRKKRRLCYGVGAGLLILALAVSLYRPLFATPITYRIFSVRNIFSAGEKLTELTKMDEIVQSFSTRIAFNHILVQGYLNDTSYTGPGCQIELQDAKGNLLAERTLSGAEITAEQLKLEFDPIVPEGETSYRIVIKPLMEKKENGLNLYRFNGALDLYKDGAIVKNGKDENGDLIFSVYYEDTYAKAYA